MKYNELPGAYDFNLKLYPQYADVELVLGQIHQVLLDTDNRNRWLDRSAHPVMLIIPVRLSALFVDVFGWLEHTTTGDTPSRDQLIRSSSLLATDPDEGPGQTEREFTAGIYLSQHDGAQEMEALANAPDRTPDPAAEDEPRNQW